MDDVQIRPVAASDLPRLMGIDHSATSEYVWQLEIHREAWQVIATFREVRLPRPVTLTYPHDPFALADNWTERAAVLVTVLGADPVAYLALADDHGGAAWVRDLVVEPALRRRGIGGRLLDAARSWAGQQGCRRLFLETQSRNQGAIRLAQKHGYEFCGYNDHYYSTQDVALFFAKAA